MIELVRALEKTQIAPRPHDRRRAVRRPPALDEVLEEVGPLPPYNLLLGLCEDGRPLLFDLRDPASGASLLVSDVQLGNTLLLRAVLSSACALSGPRQVNVHLVTPHRHDYAELFARPHFGRLLHPDQLGESRLLTDLCDLAECRRFGQGRGPVHLLAVDGLDLALAALDPHPREDFRWLVENGPASGVWVFAALGTRHFRPKMVPFLQAFGTRLLGRMSAPRLAAYFAAHPDVHLRDLAPGVEAVVRSGPEVIEFLIPRTGVFPPVPHLGENREALSR